MNATQAIERMRQALRRQHKALSTEDAYVFWLRRYLKALSVMDPALSSDKKVESFLTQLARDGVSASSQNQAFNALLYFYREVLEKPFGRINALRAKAPVHERHAPSVAETQALLQTVRNEGGYPTNLICRLLYGCGLRVTEPLNLRIKDIDLERHTLCIRGAKGGNDRVVVLPACLVTELTQQMEVARAVWQRDKQDGMPVMMPNRLAKKYPEFQFNWGWAWLFPAHHVCRDPRSGNIVRFRMHEVNVQRSVKHARRKLGISVLPHELRHAYATDCLQRGTNPRAIQKSMGHKYLETTMGYFHAEALSVASPLDILPLVPPALTGNPVFSPDRPPIGPGVQRVGHTGAAPVYLAAPNSAKSAQRSPIDQTVRRTLVKPGARLNPIPLPMARSTQSQREFQRPRPERGREAFRWSLRVEPSGTLGSQLTCIPGVSEGPVTY
jgi:integron integrase